MTSPIKTCFITAPAGTNLEVLADVLRHRNIHIVRPQQLSHGAQLETEIEGALRSIDLVIGVINRERRSEWVLFELGQAWILGKRILLFAPPSFTHLPSTLRRFVTVRATLSNREAIEFALDQLIAAPERSRHPEEQPKENWPLGESADKFLQSSRSVSGLAEHIELEALVAEALREAGVQILATSGGHLQGADFAIWSDGLQPFVGNPLLVEIKVRLQGQQAASVAAQQLAKYVAAAGGLWGLLLYGAGPEELRPLPPNILAIPIEQLFRRLRSESFDAIVRDLRNLRVHGVGL